MRAVNTLDKQYITLKKGFEYQKIYLEDIYYIESRNKKIAIHAKNNITEYYHTIQDIETVLDVSFFRCHRCYIINLKHVTNYNSLVVKLENSAEIPLARRKRSQFINVLRTHPNSNSLA